jgi:hypothetical protein
MFKTRTLEKLIFSTSVSYFSFGFVNSSRYLLGIFFGGLFYDFCFRVRTLRITENLLLRLRCHPSEWKKHLHKWTRRLLLTLSLRTIPIFGINHLAFRGLGFSARDTELRRSITRNVFSYPIAPGIPLSILFEGRNIMGEDRYGQPAPDIIREPRLISRLAIETRRDLVDETYRTQQTNQRVDNVYLGTLERKIFEWLAVRNPEKFSPLDNSGKAFKPGEGRNQKNRKQRILFVGEPVRRGFSSDVTLSGSRPGSPLRKRPPGTVERSLIRFDSWFRATQRKKGREDQRGLFGLPLGRSVKVQESLFALSTTHFLRQPYLSSIGPIEPQQYIRYISSLELARQRNARRSPLYRRTIFRYITLLIKTRPRIKGSSITLSSRQQQYDLYRSRIFLYDYITISRRYCESERNFFDRKSPEPSYDIIHRSIWQRELYSYIFSGSRSRSSSVYSQQFVGNLQLVRRLFSVSWSPREGSVSSYTRKKGRVLLRRKIALDLGVFDGQKKKF